MKNILAKRFWRNAISGILPESVKKLFGKRLQGLRKSRAKFNMVFSEDRENLIVSVTDEIKLRVPKNLKDDLLYHFVNNGDCAEEMSKFISVADSSHTLFDIGAYKGLFSLIFCACNKNNTSIAYEPFADVIPTAESLIRMNHFERRIRLENCAIGEKRGVLPIFMENEGCFLQKYSHRLYGRNIMTRFTSIDDECDRTGILPDILKIDTEGYEFEVLLGAKRLLNAKKPIIFLELHLKYLERCGVEPKSVCNYLKKYNYRFFSHLGKELAPRHIYDSVKQICRFIAI